jgi:hypothetical protein
LKIFTQTRPWRQLVALPARRLLILEELFAAGNTGSNRAYWVVSVSN